MTRSEAIENLNWIREMYLDRYGENTLIDISIDGDDIQAIDMAIKSLECDIKAKKEAKRFKRKLIAIKEKIKQAVDNVYNISVLSDNEVICTEYEREYKRGYYFGMIKAAKLIDFYINERR